ncbi:insulinase family protein, partial [bacterium]|nr:insulinase family protein [bacterium]
MPIASSRSTRLAAAWLAVALVAAAPLSAAAIDLADPLPFDEAVTKGTLPNGLTYLIRENDRPEGRADLRLVVKAGSVDEDDDQRGLAHFVEHMLFNGTEKYEGNDIIAYLESIGARFGADLNAYTSFDETVYMLHIPTDKPGLLDEGFTVLSQFAAHATLETEEIEKERGVVLDEWRRRLGAGKRVFDRQIPVLLAGSRYAERLTIGLPEVIEGCDPEAIRRYYRDWYRPDRMAVVAVGDFDANDVERRIRETFGAIPAAENPREQKEWGVPAEPDTLFALEDDPELRSTSVTLSRKRTPDGAETTLGAYRDDLADMLANAMFSQRLSDLARDPEPPFFGAWRSGQSFGEKAETADLNVSVPEGGEARGLAAVLREEKRVLQHGFTQSELERAHTSAIASIEAAWAEREKTDSGAYVGEYTRHFLEGEPLPGIDAERELWREMIPAIDAEECLAAFARTRGDGGVVVLASRPTRDGLAGKDDLLAVLRDVAAQDTEPYEDVVVDGPLLAHPLPAGKVTKRETHDDINVTDLRLSNGIRVLVKPTDFQDDTVLFNLVSLGGLSMADEEDLPSAASASRLVSESGWGGHSPPELARMLSGKMASCSPYFASRRHGVSGSATVADFPTALELAVLEMTEPDLDEDAFARYIDQLRSRLAHRDADPRVRYGDRLNGINTQGNPRARPMTVDRLDEIDPERALVFYRNAFANAADFTMFLAGNVDVDALIPELERTIGSLPRKGRRPLRWVDRKVLFPKGVTRETVRAGSEPRASTTITIASYDGDDPFEWHRLRTATAVLERRLLERLREDRGATYGVSVGYDWSMIGPARTVSRVTPFGN